MMNFVSIDVPYLKSIYLDQVRAISSIESFTIAKNTPDSEDEIIDRIGNAELVTSDIYPQFTKRVFDLTDIKAIFTQSVGVDNIDIDSANKKGVKIYNAAGFNSVSVSEFVFALVTSLMRKIPLAQAHVRAGGWDYRLFQGRELAGKTIGIIGSGNVATKIAGIAKGYSMNIIAHTRNPSFLKAKRMGIKKFLPILEIMKKSDIVVLSVPLTHETIHLVDSNELSLMKRSAILVNVSRHTVVNEFALAESILDGRIYGAVLDMMITEPFNLKEQPMIIQEMVNLPNVIVTPHIGGVSEESNTHLGELFVQNVKNFLKNDLTNCVNC